MITHIWLKFLCFVSLAHFWTCNCFPQEEVLALATFKEAIYEDPNLVLSDWIELDADPCDWYGIVCSSARDHVVKINISGASIHGFLAPELSSISYLQELTLHGNNLIGTIPKELVVLKYLKILDLGENQLTGPIPTEIANLTHLIKINLQSNGLTGSLPRELGDLKYLEELRLDRNGLQGVVPAGGNLTTPHIDGMYASSPNSTGLCRGSKLKVADLSYNFFVGSIPKCLEFLPGTSFQGNCLNESVPKQRSAARCVGPSPPILPRAFNPRHQATANPSKHHQGTSKPTWLLALEIATGTMLAALLLVAFLTTFLRCNNKPPIVMPWKKLASLNDHEAVYIDSEMLKDIVRFSRQELEVACEDFSNIIGSSPDSLVYKGTINGGPEIAVISLCIKEEVWTGYLELYFQREVADLARLNHPNTGKLLGYCKESSPFSRMLVFEYASNGTLYEHLRYGERCQFSWTRRMNIALGIAHGLKYLHNELEPPFSISELTSDSVYLTDDLFPKLLDFESWKSILTRSQKNLGTIGRQGAICVLPNSIEGHILDVQGNIYSFGVLLLELVSGRPPYCKEKRCLVDWAKDFLDLPEVVSYVVDPELKHFRYEDLKVICDVVNLCLNPEPIKRPSMEEICNLLESRIDTSISVDFKSPSLAWTELALSA